MADTSISPLAKLEQGFVMITKEQVILGFAIFIIANMAMKLIDDNYRFDGWKLVKKQQ